MNKSLCYNKVNIFFLLFFILFCQSRNLAQLPSSFDLRDVGGTNYVISVKSQQGLLILLF